jgi:hypothetical protein
MKVRKSYYYIRISKEVKADALVWQEFLESFNGPNAQINKPHSPKMQTPHCQ